MNLIKATLILLNLIIFSHGYYRLTNLKCLEFDKPFATIPICRLKMVKRNIAAMDLHAKIHKGPVDNVTVNVELLKKANGFRPFLYNVTANFCQLMRNNKKYPFIEVFIKILSKYSNINHTCPYDNDIVIKDLVLKDEMFNILPLPQGEYLLNIKIAVDNDWKALVKVYCIKVDKYITIL
ncbi:hypothetical protein CVS40_12195 [Lucilia cuprina]|nr:hypothetical protein CVS40_12195 [Lucilia cuprina]